MPQAVEVKPVAGGVVYTNTSDADRLVTIKDGQDTPEAILAGGLRTVRVVLKPRESRFVDVSHEARMSSSTDTSPMQGAIQIIAGGS